MDFELLPKIKSYNTNAIINIIAIALIIVILERVDGGCGGAFDG